MAIIGMHAIIYSSKAEATRRFIREVLGFSGVELDRGWTIFAAPPAEIAVHPSEDREFHELYLMCDDIDKTGAELRAKGVMLSAIQEQPWGRLAQIPLPSGDKLGIYEPRHPTAIGRGASPPSSRNA